jgi:hypothetical protein
MLFEVIDWDDGQARPSFEIKQAERAAHERNRPARLDLTLAPTILETGERVRLCAAKWECLASSARAQPPFQRSNFQFIRNNEARDRKEGWLVDTTFNQMIA